ncbi:substrate-binding domain-containing protein [Myxosarcina sp. GI1]|uniref:substrate-binding domain-containing protein n=1 Tax=Myxosarcina sp. GI1 TaxID=1541065 RepID=UPI00055EC21C|nr:substrate-binding domain-containing protein [Myxosarcina sp. GI1]
MNKKNSNNKTIVSLGIILVSLGLTYAPLPGVKQNIIVVSGTELQEPLQELETKFEQNNSNIDLQLKFQGSQDIVNNYIDRKNDFTPTILIPANEQTLEELETRWQAQNNSEAFYSQPQAIARTILVAVAWQERSKFIFPDGKFSWSNLERALQQRSWSKIADKNNWGSFDLVITNPTRSNSGQLALNLWLQSKARNSKMASSSQGLSVTKNATVDSFDSESLFSLIKSSIYQLPRSTDILLQEFISRGANDGDIAMVYESIALYRWSQAKISQGQPYQIYYPNPSVETVATAAIAKNIDRNTAKAANKFIKFIKQPEQQEVFVKYGFRSIIPNLNLASVPKSPWQQNIPGAMLNPSVTLQQPPDSQKTAEIQRLWSRVR